MAYTRVNWEDLPSTNTPRNATNLNKMDAGIKENDDKLNGTKAMGSIVVDDVNCKNLFDKGSMVAGDRINAQPTIRISSRQVLYLEPGTYTFSTNLDTSVYRYEVNVISSPAPVSSYDTLYGSGWKTTSTLTFTVDNNTKGYFNLGVARINNSSLTLNDISSANMQLEKGSTATEYTEYKQPVKKTSAGVKEDAIFYANDFKCKNLLDKNTVTILNAYITNASVITALANSKSLYIKCKPNTTYTVSRIVDQRFVVGTTTNVPADGVTCNNKITNHTASSITITTGANDNYLVVYYFTSSATSTTAEAILDSMQIEVGSEATSYTEYKPIGEEIYSTNETKIGFFDGKPLYRIVVNTTSPSAVDTSTSIHTVSNMNVTKIDGMLHYSSSVEIPLNFYQDASHSIATYKSSGSNISMRVTASSYTSKDVTLILEYTKTTE